MIHMIKKRKTNQWPPRMDRKAVSDAMTGKPFRRGNDRTKAFCPFTLDERNCRSIMEETKRCGEQNGTSRTTLRAFVHPLDKKKVIRCADEIGLSLEAEIVLGKRILAYFGWNDEKRSSPTEIRREQIDNTLLVMSRKARDNLLQMIDNNGYSTDERVMKSDIQDLIRLYNLCLPRYCTSLDEGKLGELFMDSANSVVLIRDRGKVIAASVAERALITIDNDIIEDVEISECATHPEHRGQGLMSAIIRRIVLSIGISDDRIIYSESRASHMPINIAMRNNRMEYCGRLEKAVVIGDGTETEGVGDFSHMESLNVWALGGG